MLRNYSSSSIRLAIVAFTLPITGVSVNAGIINGFGDFSGFAIKQLDAASIPAVTPSPSPQLAAIELTSLSSNERRSIFHRAIANISQFTASFVYRVPNASTFGAGIGAAFVIQNSPAGFNALGGPPFAYGGISNSVAVSFETASSASNAASSTGLYENGVVGGGARPTGKVNFLSGNPIRVELTYSGSILHEILTDTLTLARHEVFHVIDLPMVIGSSTAFVGITAGTGSASANQVFSAFQFSNVPEPQFEYFLVIGLGWLAVERRWR